MTAGVIDEQHVDAPRTTSLSRTLVTVTAVVTALWLVVLFAWGDAPFVFTYDDAYYYFAIARNIASGHGSTFDGINLTNGYHPLWMLVSVIPFKLGLDDLVAARVLLAVQLVFGWGLSLLLIAKLLDRDLAHWPRPSRRDAAADPGRRRAATRVLAVLFALMAVNPFVVKVFVNGLETGITVTLLAALLLVGSTRRSSWTSDTTHPWRLGVGLLLAALFLGRTDSALLIGCLFLWCGAEAVRGLRTRERAPDGTGAAGRGLIALVELFAPATVTALAYLAFNNATFGTPLQISGLVKRAPLSASTIVTFAIFVVVAALIGHRGFRAAHGRRPKRSPRFVLVGAFASRTAWFAAFCVLLVGYYTVLQTQIWPWYFAPLVLYVLILFLLAVADMTDVALADAKPGATPARALAPLAAIFGVLLVGALVYEAVAFTDPNLRSIQLADRDAGLWLRDNTPESTVAASWDAGATGYFSHRSVINLDGLVNSKAYLEAFQRGDHAAFVACQGMTHLTNHGGNDDVEDRSFRDFIRAAYGDVAARDAVVVYRQPFEFSGTTLGSGGSGGSGDNGGSGDGAGGAAPRSREMASWIYAIPPGTVRAGC